MIAEPVVCLAQVGNDVRTDRGNDDDGTDEFPDGKKHSITPGTVYHERNESAMTELTEVKFAAMLSDIRGAHDLVEATNMIRKLKTLKLLLESVGTFREQSVKYALLHVEALLKVAELGGTDRLRGFERKAAEWLHAMNGEEREGYIRKCMGGILITQIWKREIGEPAKRSRAFEEAKRFRDQILEEVMENGIVDISGHKNELLHCGVPPEFINDFVDGTRNALLRAGALGVGFRTSVYILPTAENQDKMYDVIRNRYMSIKQDMLNLLWIARKHSIRTNRLYLDAGNTTEMETIVRNHLLDLLEEAGVV